MALSNAGDLELTTTRWSEVWIILPDFRHLKRDSGRDRNSAYRTVVSLPREQPTARFRYVCASPIERELLRGDVDGGVALNHGRVRITDAVAAASQMTMVIGDPHERAAVFVPTKAGFTRIAYYETEYTVKNLLTLFPFLEEAWEDESHPAI